MDKCTFCAGGPEEDNSQAEFQKYGRNRIAEGKLPICAEMCSTKALLAGDGDMVSEIYRERVVARGFGSGRLGLGHRLRPEGRLNASTSGPAQPIAPRAGGLDLAAPASGGRRARDASPALHEVDWIRHRPR